MSEIESNREPVERRRVNRDNFPPITKEQFDAAWKALRTGVVVSLETPEEIVASIEDNA